MNDGQLTNEAEVIQNETTIGANTADRVGQMFVDIIENKINNDKIDTDGTFAADSDTKVASQKATKTYVDDFVNQTANIEDAAVTEDKIANDAVTENKIADGNVSTDKIADGAITTAKIGASSVTTAKIADGAITQDQISDDEIITSKLQDNCVTSAKLASGVLPKKYVALITQYGTYAPTLTVIKNDFSGTITATRNGAGDYTLTNSVSEFTANKTSATINNSTNYAVKFTGATRTGGTTISLATFNSGGSAADTLLLNDILEIEVYV